MAPMHLGFPPHDDEARPRCPNHTVRRKGLVAFKFHLADREPTCAAGAAVSLLKRLFIVELTVTQYTPKPIQHFFYRLAERGSTTMRALKVPTDTKLAVGKALLWPLGSARSRLPLGGVAHEHLQLERRKPDACQRQYRWRPWRL